jgi:hypothetical protein
MVANKRLIVIIRALWSDLIDLSYSLSKEYIVLYASITILRAVNYAFVVRKWRIDRRILLVVVSSDRRS